jgi:hypothetical protein
MTEQKEYFCFTKEGRREYYEKNKERIKKARKAKEICSKCGRCVGHGQMTRHQATSYCERHSGIPKDTLTVLANENKAINLDGPDVREKLLEQIDKLQDYINTLDAN